MKKIKKIINKVLKIKKHLENKYGKIQIGNISARSAEVSFYMLLSIFPFLLFTISSVVFIPMVYLNKYINILSNIVPPTVFPIIETMIRSIIGNRSVKLLIMSFFLAIWSMSKAVKSLIRGVNRSYGVIEDRSFFEVLFISLIFAAMLILLLIVSMILLIFGEKLGIFIFNLIGLNNYFMYIWNVLRYTIGIIIVIIVLVGLYTVTPNIEIMYKDSIPGAVFSTFSWIVVTYAYSFYINNFSTYDVIYGSLGGIIVLITWLYLSSYTIFLGCELNARLLYKKRNTIRRKSRYIIKKNND